MHNGYAKRFFTSLSFNILKSVNIITKSKSKAQSQNQYQPQSLTKSKSKSKPKLKPKQAKKAKAAKTQNNDKINNGKHIRGTKKAHYKHIDKTHILFAANVQMPNFDALDACFNTFQNRRDVFKAVHSKKEVNSITKLTMNYNLRKIEKEKGFEEIKENIVLSVAIFHSNKSSERFTKSHEFLVLGEQYLSELKDCLYCLMDKSLIGPTIKNSFFFIEGAFYDNTRHNPTHRISQPIVDWSRENEHYLQTGIYSQEIMEKNTI